MRISGVTVGKVKTIDPGRDGRSKAIIELEHAVRADPEGHAGDPAPEDAARRDLRRADARARRARRRCPRTGRCRTSQRLADGRARRDLPRVRPARRAQAFQIWMQTAGAGDRAAAAQDLNDALGNLAPFAEDADAPAAHPERAGGRGAPARAQHRRGVRRADRARRPAALADHELQRRVRHDGRIATASCTTIFHGAADVRERVGADASTRLTAVRAPTPTR